MTSETLGCHVIRDTGEVGAGSGAPMSPPPRADLSAWAAYSCAACEGVLAASDVRSECRSVRGLWCTGLDRKACIPHEDCIFGSKTWVLGAFSWTKSMSSMRKAVLDPVARPWNSAAPAAPAGGGTTSLDLWLIGAAARGPGPLCGLSGSWCRQRGGLPGPCPTGRPAGRRSMPVS